MCSVYGKDAVSIRTCPKKVDREFCRLKIRILFTINLLYETRHDLVFKPIFQWNWLMRDDSQSFSTAFFSAVCCAVKLWPDE